MLREPNHPLLAIVGPTGVGKTVLAVLLASRSPIEVISVDSRQVYKYMDIGTAKPTKKELEKARHHLIDVVEPDELYNAGRFVREAREAVEEIRSRGRRPLLVGGTGLYLKAFVDGLIESPRVDQQLRRKLQDEASRKGNDFLHAELQKIDPATAARIHPNDILRIIRALEIYHQTGKPYSQLMQEQRSESPPIKIYSLFQERKHLYRRLDKRVETMVSEGLVEETKSLLMKGYDPSLPSFECIGYRQIILYLKGNLSLVEAMESIKKETRNLAKRQLTWFRGMKGLSWIDLSPRGSIENAARIIEKESGKDG